MQWCSSVRSRGSCSSKSLFVEYDLSRNEVTSIRGGTAPSRGANVVVEWREKVEEKLPLLVKEEAG